MNSECPKKPFDPPFFMSSDWLSYSPINKQKHYPFTSRLGKVCYWYLELVLPSQDLTNYTCNNELGSLFFWYICRDNIQNFQCKNKKNKKSEIRLVKNLKLFSNSKIMKISNLSVLKCDQLHMTTYTERTSIKQCQRTKA